MGRVNNNRMRNIYQEARNVYRIEISNGFRDDGTRDRIVERVYGSEEDAIKRRDEIKAKKKQMKEEGLIAQNGGYTLTEIARLYLDDIKYRKRSLTTVRGYKQLLNNWILPELGDIKIRNINEQDLEKLYDKMRESINANTGNKLSETYINHCHKLISSIYNYAKKKKWILTNPAEYVINPPKINNNPREYYSYDEIMKVLSLLNDEDLRFKTAITLLFNTGMRRGELLGLKYSDITTKSISSIVNGKRTTTITYAISINKELVEIKIENLKSPEFIKRFEIIEQVSSGLATIKPKTDKSNRIVMIPKECYDLIMEYKNKQKDDGLDVKENSFVFKTKDFTVWRPNYLTKQWKNFIEKNNLKKISVHDIRHSHATYLLTLGTPVQDVSRRLGHSDPTTTLRIYTHSNLTQDQKIAESLSYSNNSQKENNISPSVILGIITNKMNYIDINDLANTLSWILQKDISFDSVDESVKVAINYLLSTNDDLLKFNNLINKINEEEVDIMVNAFNTIINVNIVPKQITNSNAS